MFDEVGTEPALAREQRRVGGVVTSLLGLAVLTLDELIRRPEDSAWRVLTYAVIIVASIAQLRGVNALDRSSRLRLAVLSMVGAALLVAGLYARSLLVWLLGLGLFVVSHAASRWYSEGAGPTTYEPDRY